MFLAVLVEAPSLDNDTPLPWKRMSRAPLSSSVTHMMPSDDSPVVGEAPSWVDSATLCPTAEPPATSSLRSTRSHAGELFARAPGVATPLERSATAPQGVMFMVGSSDCGSGDREEVGKTEQEDDYGLPPPPWRHVVESTPNAAVVTAVVTDPTDDAQPSPLPWQCEDADVTVMPWRHVNAADDGAVVAPAAATATAATTPEEWDAGGLPPPWRQASVATTSQAGADSLRPQMSLRSLRLSEAESKHSAPIHLHHMIERMSGGRAAGGGSEAGGGLDHLDSQQVDSYDRIAQWLLDSTPDLDEPTIDVVDAASAASATDNDDDEVTHV